MGEVASVANRVRRAHGNSTRDGDRNSRPDGTKLAMRGRGPPRLQSHSEDKKLQREVEEVIRRGRRSPRIMRGWRVRSCSIGI